MYLLVRASEDRNRFLDEKELRELLADPGQYGINEFMEIIPEDDPNYWDRDVVLLLKVELLSPVKQVAWVLPEAETLPPFKAAASPLRATWLTGHGIVDVSDPVY